MPQRKRRAKVANPGPVKSRSKQAAKAKKKSNVEAAIRSLDQELGQRRRRYQQFVASIRDLPGVQRAEKWLEYAVGDAREDGDEEASVYFLSRGHPELANIEEFIADWKRGAQSVLDDVDKPDVIYTARGIKRGEPKQKRDASQIFADNPTDLRYFWFRSHQNDWFADATMLRAVEWGEIGGFDDWWKKLARDEYEAAFGGTEPVPASYWVFAMSRSAYACKMLRRPLLRHLEAVAFASEGQYPWVRYQFSEPLPRQTTFLAYTAHLAFAGTVIPNSGIEPNLLEAAAETLVKYQSEAGYWDFMQGIERPSTLTTAAAVHSLAVVDVRGGKRAISKAARWLDSVQSPDGPWNGPERIGHPTFATVLVLDAKALAEGTGPTTATTIRTGVTSARTTPAERRYKVALSFSGQVRPLVDSIATYLASRLTKHLIFYDEFHQADLVRMDLDLYLQDIYANQSDVLVVFISAGYADGDWPQLEWRAIRDIIKKRRGKGVVLVRDDDTVLPGVLSIDGYIDSRTHNDSEIAEVILHRLRAVTGAQESA